MQTIVTTELLASRYSLEHGASVTYWPFGMTSDEAATADKERRAKLAGKPAEKTVKPSTKAVD